ncbi:MAG: hypothetical protein KGL39_52465, partial [Patescibacteria group bacterium]|nr:hypothetical protein [Patescibacteria group bacterium]
IALHNKYYSDIPIGQFTKAIEYDTEKADPTKDQSGLDNFIAGIGKSFADTGRGLGQMVGAVSRKDVAESRKLDDALMNTTGGKIGNFTGEVATTLPLAFVPGANTVKGATLIGSLSGLARPSESTGETLVNTGLGGLAGGGSILAGRGAAAAYQGATGLLRPLTEKGRQQIAAEVLQASATDPAKAVANLKNAQVFVPGSVPTVGQGANDAGLAQLERTLLNNPDTAQSIQRAYEAQQAARTSAVAGVAGTPEHRAAIEEGRRIFANQDYAHAFAQGMDADMARALSPQIANLMERPSIQEAKGVAIRLAKENGQELSNFGSVQGMDWLVKALNNKISAAAAPGSSIGKEELRALMQTKNDLMSVIEQVSPAYKEAMANYAAMSKQVNAANVAADLQSRLYKNAHWGSNKEMGSTYQTELLKALDSVKKQTGMDMPINKVMNPKDLTALEGVARDLARKENAQNLGRAVGSPTMQNMMGQNLLNRIAGPLGMPQSFSQSVLADTLLSRPYDFVMRSAQPKIGGLLSEAMTDPVKAQALLTAVKNPSKFGPLARKAEQYLPVGGLLALEGVK